MQKCIFLSLALKSWAARDCKYASDPASGKQTNGVWMETAYSATDTGHQTIVDYSKCVYVVAGVYKSWTEANRWCQQNVPKSASCTDNSCYGTLVSLHTQSQNKVLEKQIAYAPGTYWIGLRQHCSSCSFEWTDFSPLDSLHWFDGEPNDSGDGEDCVTFTYHDGDEQNAAGKYWNDDGCYKEFSFICEAYDDNFHVPKDPWPAYGGCKAGWYKFGGGCYRPFGYFNADDSDPGKLAFHDANFHCDVVWRGATLAVLPNWFYQFYATSLMHLVRDRVWIGGVTTSDQDHLFHWIDNTKMVFTNWQPGEPNGDQDGEDAIEMTYFSYVDENRANAGEWNDLSPLNQKPFLCSHPVSTSESGEGLNPHNCPAGWMPFRAFCYKFSSDQLPFDDARTSCMSTPNTDLVSITDVYEFNFVRSMLYGKETPPSQSNPHPDAAWIGMVGTRGSDGAVQFKWVDDFPLSNTFWEMNEPDPSKLTDKVCIAMNSPYGHWQVGMGCTTRLPYVCKQNMENVPNPNDRPDDRGPALDCPAGWSTFSSDAFHCYKPFAEDVDWFTANGKCKEKFNGAGNLISIHSEAMNQNAKSLFNSVDEGKMWTGAKRNEINGFIWTDGSEFSYTKWGKGEPTGSWNGEPENCLEIERDAYWNDMKCGETNGYMCQVARMHQNCIVVAEPDKIPCAARAEHQCGQEKCCWDANSSIKCFRPSGSGSGGSGSMSPGKAAGIVSGVFIFINIGAIAYFTMAFRR